jgi:two-component system chemotaxis response regulator CheY
METNGLRILIVEDSALILERMDNMLSELDCISEVLKSENGIDALTSVYEKKPDVILLDINLPGKSGISILKEIKSQSLVKVVMLTNYSDQYYRTLCAELGADHFLDKSTEFEKIPALLKSIHTSKV